MGRQTHNSHEGSSNRDIADMKGEEWKKRNKGAKLAIRLSSWKQ